MESKMEFLRKYHKNVEIIQFIDLNMNDKELIPNEWYEAFKEKDIKKRFENLLGVWKQHVGIELRNTISYLSEKLINIELIKYDGKYSVLYTIKPFDEGEYYEGGNPKDLFSNVKLKDSWNRIPSSIRKFYENVHNGFYYYSSQAMGLVPFEFVTFFDDDEWGILDELKEPLQIDLKTTFGFFKNGLGGYVAIDYRNCENNNATLWWVNKQPKYNVNFWDVVDEWIVIGFES